MKLPPTIDVATFDALHDDAERWQDVVASIAAGHSPAPVRPVAEGTVLVGLVGDELVVKLYPPFLRDLSRSSSRHCSSCTAASACQLRAWLPPASVTLGPTS